jgi:hypothetical protein
MNARSGTRAGVIAVLAAALTVALNLAAATDLDASLDMRLVGADAPRSYSDGGLGILRFGDEGDGLQLGRARFAVSQEIGEYLTAKIDASAWGQHAKNSVDVTEA